MSSYGLSEAEQRRIAERYLQQQGAKLQAEQNSWQKFWAWWEANITPAARNLGETAMHAAPLIDLAQRVYQTWIAPALARRRNQ